MPGRLPKPVLIRKREGSFIKARDSRKVSVPCQRLGPPPENFSPDAKDEWVRITTAPVLSELLAEAHRDALTEYCILHARMLADARDPDDHRMTGDERRALHSLRLQFGLTPLSQGRLKVADAEKQPENRFAKLG